MSPASARSACSKRTTEVVKHREGGDPSSSRKSPGRTEYDAITLERGVTHDTEFEAMGQQGMELGAASARRFAAGLPQGHHHRDVQRSRAARDLPTRSTAAGCRNIRHCRTWTPTPTRSRFSISSSRTKDGCATFRLPSRPNRPSRRRRNGLMVHTLSPRALLDAWERGLAQSPVELGLTLLVAPPRRIERASRR